MGQSGDELGPQSWYPNMETLRRQNRLTSEPVRREIIDEHRAAHLLGLPTEQLREICEMSGLGHLEQDEMVLRLVFTYEELYRLCRLIVGPTS